MPDKGSRREGENGPLSAYDHIMQGGFLVAQFSDDVSVLIGRGEDNKIRSVILTNGNLSPEANSQLIESLGGKEAIVRSAFAQAGLVEALGKKLTVKAELEVASREDLKKFFPEDKS